jgi:hypothetical protein
MTAQNPSGRDRFRWMEAAMASTHLLPAEKLLATRLGLHCNDETGRCNPGEDTLIKGTALSGRYLRKIKAALRTKGWITYADNPGGDPKSTNQYVLLMKLVPSDGPPRNAGSGVVTVADRAVRNGRAALTPEPQHRDPGTPVPPNINANNNSNTNADGDGGDDARAREADLHVKATSLARQIAETAGLPPTGRWPQNWQKAAEQVLNWWKRGYSTDVILTGVRMAMARKSDPDTQPNSIKYFENPIKQAFDAITRPLPSTGPAIGSHAARRDRHTSYQLCLSEIAEQVGWIVVTSLSQSRADDLVARWSKGAVPNDELHRIKVEIEAQLAKADARA